MNIIVPASDGREGLECSLCQESISFYGERHNLTECFKSLRERVELLEATSAYLTKRVLILESTEASNRNA